jgi:mannosidase alpha-like ER degradation enhancer 2
LRGIRLSSLVQVAQVARVMLLAIAIAFSAGPTGARAADVADVAELGAAESQQLADQVRREFLHAWHGYVRYAWGHDELLPLSKKPRDWYGPSLLMTPVDSLDALIVLGFKDEARRTRELIDTRLSFDQDIYVKNFEITIRLLGGLLSGYQMSGDPRLLALAHDLGTRLLPVFKSPTGLPYEYVNLRTGGVRGTGTNPAETGSLLLEFGTLSRLTKDPVFYDTAKRALVETFRRRSAIGLVGDSIDVESGNWTNTDSHISGDIDSYYEYLWKCWKLFGDKDCLEMWNASIAAVDKYLPEEIGGELWYGHADMNTGMRTSSEFGALDAFFPGLLAFADRMAPARRLQESSFKMWNVQGIEPESYDYRSGVIKDPRYPLRPEIIESTYYLYRLSGDPRYRVMARSMWRDFVKYCRAAQGYAALESVVTKKQKDSMQSFLFAETFKYFYLAFAPPAALDFEAIVFNTEAHPLRRFRQ